MPTVYEFLNPDSTEVEEQRIIRASGATAGDVLTVAANGTVSPAPDGGSRPWDEATISMAEADWTDDGVGTWTFVDGVISQADATADSCLNYTADVFVSPEYVVEAEIKIPSGQDAGTTSNVTVTVGTPSFDGVGTTGVGANQGFGGSLQAAGTGDDQDILVLDWQDGNSNSDPFPTAIVQDEWHTLRVVSNGLVTAVYLDAVYLFTQQQVTGGNGAAPGPPVKSCDLLAVAAVGLAQYRNVKVWTRPLPA